MKNFLGEGMVMQERGKEDKKCGEGCTNIFGGGGLKKTKCGGGGYKEFFGEEYNNNLRQLLASIEK